MERPVRDGGVDDLAAGGVDAGDGGGGAGSCVDGSQCMTSNPGDCAVGHVVCNHDVATCVPNVTAQPCYDGPTGTRDVGMCHAGMQTCIETLGPCSGEVKPAVQDNCFTGTDDNCNGTVGDGCPDHLATGTPRALGTDGNPAGGGPFSLRCPANSYVTKVVVYADTTDATGWIGGLDIACATPTLVRGVSRYTVTPTPVTPTPDHWYAKHVNLSANNTTVSPPLNFDCGTSSFSPGWWSVGTSVNAAAGGVESVGMQCATGTLTLSATNQLTLALLKQGTATHYGYTTGTSFDEDCAANEVLIGYDGRSGWYFDEIQPVCAPLQVVYK
jgi:hypothetical protein